MKNWLFPLVVTLLFTQTTSANPENRCRVTHCLCKVRGDVGRNKIPSTNTFKDIVTSNNSSNDLKNISENKKLTVFFGYDKHALNGNDRVDISKYVRTNYFAGGFHLDGHASSAGNASYNQQLSQKRIYSVISQVNRYNSKPMRMRAESFGERYSSASDSGKDRKVTITPIHDFVELLDFKKTNYYLIDQSGSMQKYWKEIQEYKFWSRSVKIFLSTVNTCDLGAHLKQIGSYGGTHIWYSFWNLIDQMTPGSSITIVSDFQTPVPLNSREWSQIRTKLASKRIKLSDVHFVQIEGASVFRQITR
jgi:outer membrane protein OmpA-like peptidoglycan-associated protein